MDRQVEPTPENAAEGTAEPEIENTLIKYFWARILADDDVSVWDRDGLAQLTEDLPISLDLRERLDAWALRYDELDSAIQGAGLDRAMGFDVELPSEDWGPLAREGFLLACEVKKALPDWTVMYFDQEIYVRGPRLFSRQGKPKAEYEIFFDRKGECCGQ
jgi:hypothetical protein